MNINRRTFLSGLASSAFVLPTIANINSEFDDLIEFSKTCKIVDFKSGLHNFNPRQYQIEYFNMLLKSNNLVCRKCRQCGATTMNLIYAHWVAERHPNKKVLIVFNNHMLVDKAKDMFNIMFYDNSSKLYENTPNVEFKLDDTIFDMALEQGWSNFYMQLKSGEHPYFNSNTILICDEYEFSRYWFCADLMVNRRIDFMKTIWSGTPNISVDSVFWQNRDMDGHISKMKITGEQVFPQSRLAELRNCLGDERFNQEIQV